MEALYQNFKYLDTMFLTRDVDNKLNKFNRFLQSEFFQSLDFKQDYFHLSDCTPQELDVDIES